jgi:3-oxoacyl-[acyl-carrier-protein] synthase II
VGSGIGGLPLIEQTEDEYQARGPRRISPFFVPASIINMISGHVSIKFGFKGPNIAIVTACTTGLHAIGTSARMIEYGDADVMVCGGAEAAISPLGIGGFAAMRALSTHGIKTARALCWARAQVCWCWKSMNTPRRVARASTASCQGLA